jgi:ABC-type Mn2+/Zn2+ transport system permease subunit
MIVNFFHIVGASLFVAATGAYLGSFVLLRRMALVGDALSHIAMPGIALGLIFHFDVFWGALTFLVFGSIIIWAIEHKTRLPVDTLVGILFTLALAIGALLMSEHELEASLFGSIESFAATDFLIVSLLSFGILSFLYLFSRQLTVALISEDLALSMGLRPHLLEFLFLLLFAFAVGVGIKFAGVLLMGALIIIPAATAKNFARSMAHFQLLSICFGVAGIGAGILAYRFFGFAFAPSTVIVEAVLFFLSILPKLKIKNV